MPNINNSNISAVRLAEQGSAPATPASGFWKLYVKAAGLFVRKSDGTEVGPFTTGGMTNPMTTLDDIIVGGASGTPTRVAKGSNNTVWGVNGSGVLGYKADPAGSSGALTLISDTTLAVDTASVTFSSISGSYKHLMLIVDARETGAVTVDNLLLRFNGDTGANYDYQRIRAVGSTLSGAEFFGLTSAVVGWITGSSGTANFSGISDILIPNYASTVFQKTAISRTFTRHSTATLGMSILTIGAAWRSTAAVTQIDLLPSSGNFLTGSRFSLYGIS